MELATLQDQSDTIESLQARVQQHKSDFDTVTMRLRFLEETSAPTETVSQLEAKIRELQSKLAFEVTSRIRSEVRMFACVSLYRVTEWQF